MNLINRNYYINRYIGLIILFFLLFIKSLTNESGHFHKQDAEIEIESTQCICEGSPSGVINLIAEGDAGPFTFEWKGPTQSYYYSLSQSPSNIFTPGLYTVTVTNNYACETILSVNVEQCPAIQDLQINGEDACEGSDGGISVSYSSGVEPITFLWSTGATTQDVAGLGPGTYEVTVTDGNECENVLSYTIESTTQLSLNAQITHTGCDPNNGTGIITITPTEGNPSDYTWNWSHSGTENDNIAENLLTGTYTVTATNNATGCMVSENYTIASENAPMVTGTITHLSCAGANDGAIDITITGGAGSNTITWDMGAMTEDISSLAAGTYCVTVEDINNCEATACFELMEVAQINSTATITPDCITGATTIDIVATGGTAPYTYTWNGSIGSSSFTTSTPGIYTLIITDAVGCTKEESFTISQIPPLVTPTITNTNCGVNTGCIALSVTGASPFTYTWSNGAGGLDNCNLAAGSYTVTVLDANGCSTIEQFEVGTENNLTATTTVTNESCSNASDASVTVQVAGGTANPGYTLSTGVSNFTGIFNNLTSGDYGVTVTDLNGCSAVTYFEIIANTTITVDAEITNDCDHMGEGSIDISISGGQGPYMIDWLDVEGNLNLEDRTGLNLGFYEVVITDMNGCSTTEGYTIADYSGPSISAAIVSATCEGADDGRIVLTVDANGSGNNFSYNWVDGNEATINSSEGHTIENLAAGTYCVTVTNNNVNCAVEDCYTINSSSSVEAPYLDRVQVRALVDGTSILIYQAEWQPSFSGCLVFTGGNLDFSDDLFTQMLNNECDS